VTGIASTEPSLGRRFRRAAGCFPTGVTLVATLVDGQPHGMTVNSFVTASIEPLLVQISLHNDSHTFRHITTSGSFAVTVLAADQQDVARWFATPGRPAGAAGFAGVDWCPGPATGSPILLDGVCYFDCAVQTTHRTGDHTTLVGSVREFDVVSGASPLLFVGSGFAGVR
jgi:flavin reductase (DIM6/NTAB) family NADH-FMN oxidoreductase RutF